MLRPLLQGTPSDRVRHIWLAVEALIADAVPKGRWMWTPLAGAAPEAIVEAHLRRKSLTHALVLARVEGTQGHSWAMIDDQGYGVLGRHVDGGTLILPALLRFDSHQGQHGRALPNHPIALEISHKGTARPATRARLPHPITAHPPRGQGTAQGKAHREALEAAARLCADVDTLASIFDHAQGDGRLPHLQDGAYGPSLWPAAAPRPADPKALEQGQRALDAAAAWVWAARGLWGQAETPFSLERPGYNGNRLLVRTPGRHPWTPRKPTHLVVEHLERAFPPALAQALEAVLRTPLGRAIAPNTQKGGLGPCDATPLSCAMAAPPTQHALMAALAHGLPTPRHQAFWEATFAPPKD